jgi:hypothetical protein
MKGGFGLLTTRSLVETLELSEQERKLGEHLPDLYKVFLQSFHIKENCLKKELYQNYRYKDGSLEKDFTFSYCATFSYNQTNKSVLFPVNHLVFDTFIDIEMSVNVFLEEKEFCNDERKKNMLNIGVAGPSGGIYVGLKGEESDRIYFIGDLDMYLIAANIFEFVRALEFVSNAENPEIMEKVPYEKLYLNWNETFWRVRE